MIDSLWRTFTRWFGPSTNPPLPMKLPVENWSRPASSASAVVSITVCRETLWAAIRSGSARTESIWMRSPQIGTLATPGTRSSRWRIVQ